MTPEQYSVICRELLLTCRDMASIMHSRIAPLCRKAGISVQQLYVLEELRDNPEQRITQLCERIGIQRTNFTLLSKKLECQGLALRVQSPSDRRAYSLVITDAGERILEDVNDQIMVQFRDTFDGVSDETVEAMLKGVRELRLGCGRMR